MKALVPNTGVDAEYIARFIQSSSPKILHWVRATTADNFPLDELEGLKVPLPTLVEQQRIAKELEQSDHLRRIRRHAVEVCDDFRLNSFREELLKCNAELIPLDEICLKITDGVHVTPTYIKIGVPFLRVTDIQDQEVDWSQVKRISRDEYNEITRRTKPELGDVLYSKNGTIGIAKEITWREPFAHFVSLALVKPDRERINPTYLTAWLNTPDALRQATSHSKTLTVTNLHLNEIEKMWIPLPSIPDQKELVGLVTNGNHLRATHVEALRQADHLFQTLLHQSFSPQ